MQILGMILAAGGGIAALIYAVRLLILAFKTSVLWGLGTLCIPLVGLIFVIKYWSEAGKLFLYYLLFLVVAGIGAGISTMAAR
jgi:hypothetical protein